MKAVQVMLDERLLAALDADPEVRAVGRSAIIRAAVEGWLKQRRAAAIDAAYRHGYGVGAPDQELQGWAEEGAWPED